MNNVTLKSDFVTCRKRFRGVEGSISQLLGTLGRCNLEHTFTNKHKLFILSQLSDIVAHTPSLYRPNRSRGVYLMWNVKLKFSL